MRRLCLVLIATGICYFGLYLVADQATPAAHFLRDGLILTLSGALLFALQAQPVPGDDQPEAQNGRTWLILLAITAIAAAARLWQLMSLPADCLDAECERALNVAAGG